MTACPRLHGLVSELENLINELTKKETSIQHSVEKLSELLDHFPIKDATTVDDNDSWLKVESCSVSIWNFSVAKKTCGELNSELNAKLRHIACNLFHVSRMGKVDEIAYRKQITMALKTSRAWLDAGKPSMADNSLSITGEFLEKLHQLVANKADHGGVETIKTDIEKDNFKLMCYKAESEFGQQKTEEAYTSASRAKEMLYTLPREAGFLAVMCYNFGVDTFHGKIYEQSVRWLREGFEIGKGVISPQCQARTLRLLANAYMEWNASEYWQTAINVVGLANAEHAHPAGLYLKIRILLHDENSDPQIGAAFSDLLRHPEINTDLALNAAKMMLNQYRKTLAFASMQQLLEVNENSTDVGKIYIIYIEMLIGEKEVSKAQDLVENCITGHNSGHPIDPVIQRRLHMVCWQQASIAYEDKDYKNALQWYNYSFSLYGTSDGISENFGKLHRNRALCYMNLDNQIDKALEASQRALQTDPKCPYTYYVLFKLALLADNEVSAIEAIHNIAGCINKADHEVLVDSERGAELIALAAQLAFDKGNRNVAITAIEEMVEKSQLNQQVITALRCLSRLKMTLISDSPDNSDERQKVIKNVIQYISTAHEKLLKISKNPDQNGGQSNINVQNEASWFMKIAWNLALQNGMSSHDMHQLFTLCYKLTLLCPTDLANMVRQKTCMMMGAAACLESARILSDMEEKRILYYQTLDDIDKCRDVCQKIFSESKLSEQKDTKNNDTAPLLLVLYEFEAKAKLNDTNLEAVLEKALTLPNTEPKTFDTLAALSMEAPAQNRTVCFRTLKIAIKRYLQCDVIDYVKCSKSFHSLIQLAFQHPSNQQDVWAHYVDANNVIIQAKGNFPEMEILWLMTKAWNYGIQLYSNEKVKEAEQWCGLSMGLLQQLTSLKCNYEDQMAKVYGDILAKLQGEQKEQTT